MKHTHRLLAIVCAFSLCFLPFADALGETASCEGFTFDTSAEYLDLDGLCVRDWEPFMDFLRSFGNLRKVDMFSTIVEKSDISRLAEAFPDVEFGWTIHIARDHYIRTDATAFSTLHGNCDNHTSEVFEVLRYCTRLRALDIGHNNVTSLDFLKDLKHLRVLILACNPHLQDISVIGTLQELEYLELFSCALTDISCLKDLPWLTDLNIANNGGLKDHSPLLEMKQLKRLWVSATPFASGRRLNELRSALPDTRIQNQGEPTAFGWRKEDPHYQVIYQIFHSGVYIPFTDSAQPPAFP